MKEIYYVTLNPQEMEIGQYRDDSQLIQYEIEVTDRELKEVQDMITNYRYDQYGVLDIFTHLFNEHDVDSDKRQELRNLEKLYNLLYRYGTEKTKRDLKTVQRANNHLK